MKKDYIVELREEEADELMNEHWVGELVRCKDCKHFDPDGIYTMCRLTGILHAADWYCADGEPKESR